MQAQQNFGSYVNELFFRLYQGEPDSTVKQFLLDSVPAFFSPHITTGKWTAYEEAKVVPPVQKSYSHVFNKHPFLDIPSKIGELKITTNVFKDERFDKEGSIKDIELILKFDLLENAKIFFNTLRGNLLNLGREKFFHKNAEEEFIEVFTPELIYDVPGKVKITLSKKKDSNALYQVSILQ